MTVSRRFVGTGLALAALSASVGAAGDRIFSRSRSSVTADQEAAALEAQSRSLAQAQSQALQAAAASAARDKADALTQVEAQLPSTTDPRLSIGLERLSQVRPWLRDLTSTIGYVECAIGGVAYRGAAELLDHHGALVMCGHEFVRVAREAAQLHVTFFGGRGRMVRSPFTMLSVDYDRDIAFANLRPGPSASAIARGLRPVRWARPPSQEPTTGDQVVFVGFPEGIARLHASTGTIRRARQVDTINEDGSIASHRCKIESDGVTFSGMSGGGVFRKGDFVGLVNFSSPAGSNPLTYFTPASAIASAYAVLFPERAKLDLPTSLTASPISKALSKDCEFNRRDFLTIAPR